MSIAKSSLFSGIRGTFGNVIVYEVNGETRIRCKPSEYRDSKSKGQLAQRQRFRKVTELYHLLDRGLYHAWKQQTAGTSLTAYNLFVRANIRNFTNEGEVSDYASMKMCTGTLPLPEAIEATISPGGEVSVRWKFNPLRKENAYNWIKLILYTP